MIIILSLKNQQMSLRDNMNDLGKTFSVSIKKEITKIDKDDNESIVNISYKTKFVDSARFVVSSLPNRVENLGKEIHKIKCKDYGCFLEYESVKDNVIKDKSLSCNKDYSNNPDEKLVKET